MPQFAEHWNVCIDRDDMDVLCYEVPPQLPANFTVISLGKQLEHARWVSRGLIDYFDGLEDEYVLIALEDYMVSRVVRGGTLDMVEAFCKSMALDKFDLTKDTASRGHSDWWGDFAEAAQKALYRTSLQMAVWRVDYFRRFLVENRTPWTFETMGTKEAREDGARIFGTHSGIVEYNNAMNKGSPCGN
jgi:hypothetical protein